MGPAKIKGMISFDLDLMTTWYLEPELLEQDPKRLPFRNFIWPRLRMSKSQRKHSGLQRVEKIKQ